MSKAQGMQRTNCRLESGWQPIVVEGCRGYRLGNWLTWFNPAKGWLWLWAGLPKVSA